jgi:hypothetical protein
MEIVDFIRSLPIWVPVLGLFLMAPLTGWFIKVIYDMLKGIKKSFDDNFVKIDRNFERVARKIDLIEMKHDAGDFALDKLLQRNGDSYKGYKHKEFMRLYEEYQANQGGK